MYGYTLNENGSVVHYGTTPAVEDPATYQTDVYSAKAADFIRRRAPSDKPFFLSVAPLASHSEVGPATTQDNNPRAALRHEGALAGELPPSNPAFNEADVSDKPQSIRDLNPMTPAQQELARDRYRPASESLLAVDEMVQNIADTLKAKGEFEDTVIIFTSDNGFFHGEHRSPPGQDPPLRGVDPSPAADARPRHPEGEGALAAGRATSTWRRRSPTSPTRSPSAASTGGRCCRWPRTASSRRGGRSASRPSSTRTPTRTPRPRRPTTRRFAPTATSTPSTGRASRSCTTSTRIPSSSRACTRTRARPRSRRRSTACLRAPRLAPAAAAPRARR